MECENEACHGRKKDYCLIHGNWVLSCFKIVIDNRSLQVLYFPPKFARSVSHLTDQETYLEDSSGRRWRVTVCNHNGSLSIQQGWPKFISDHRLNLGDFLVFHYVPGQHFIVKIFGPHGCEKKKSYSDTGNERKRVRTYPEATTPSELFQTPDITVLEKKSRKSDELESEKVLYKPNITDFSKNIDDETGKGQSVHLAINVDESFCMIDRSSLYDQEDDRLCLDLSSFEMPASKPLAEGTSCLLKGDIRNDNHVETNLRSEEEPNLNVEISNLNSEALLSKLEAGITTINMVSRPAEDIPLPGPKYKKSNKASQFEYVAQGAKPDMFSLRIQEPQQKEYIKKHRSPPSEDINCVYDVDPISWAPPSGNTSLQGGQVPFAPFVAASLHVSDGNSTKKPRLMGECDAVIK